MAEMEHVAVAQETPVLQTEPVVQAEDFPKPNSRLQELMKNYRQDKNLPNIEVAAPTKVSLPNVKVSNTLKTKTYDDLIPENQAKVLERVRDINYLVSSDILNFGSAKESPMTKHAEIIISKYPAGEAVVVTDPMTDLVATLKSNNPRDIVSKITKDGMVEKEGIFSSLSRIFSMKKMRKKMAKALAERASVLENLKQIENELENQQKSLQKDIEVYESMGRSTVQQVSEFELDCIALQLLIDDATVELNKITSKEEIDLEEHTKAKELSNAIDRMGRRMYTIQTVRVSTIQTVPQLSTLIYGDEIICEKIDEVQSLVIPLWTWQYAIAIGAIKQQEALSVQKAIRGITSKLLTGNAKMLHDNMIAAQEELYASAVAIEDLATVQEYIDDMVVKVNETRKEAAAKSVEGMKTMREIEEKNYKLLADTATLNN